MSIEFVFNSVVVSQQEIQEQLPDIFSAIKTYLPAQKTPKRRRARRRKKTVCCLIDDIIEDIDTE